MYSYVYIYLNTYTYKQGSIFKKMGKTKKRNLS